MEAVCSRPQTKNVIQKSSNVYSWEKTALLKNVNGAAHISHVASGKEHMGLFHKAGSEKTEFVNHELRETCRYFPIFFPVWLNQDTEENDHSLSPIKHQ